MPATDPIAYIAALDDPVRPIAERLAADITAALSDATSKLYQGIPVWTFGGSPAVGIKAATKFVSLMFFQGQRFADASGRLVGSGSFEMATVKFTSVDEIDAAPLADWLAQARTNGPIA